LVQKIRESIQYNLDGPLRVDIEFSLYYAYIGVITRGLESDNETNERNEHVRRK